jgi:RsiW-degrading membrane proteinase PrsW (M82 family)
MMSEINVETTHPSDETPEAQPHGEAPHWSDRAQQRLLQARVIGLLMVLSGAVAFVIGSTLSGVLTSFLANGGLTLLVTGLVVITAAMRTHGISPDQSFAPASIVNPRMWFVLLWGAGIALVVMLNAVEPGATTEQILMLIVSTPLMVVGGLWILRWLSGQVARQWPLDMAQLALQWVPTWTVIWAGVWGLISTVAAFVIEASPVLLLALLSGAAFTDVSRTPLSPYESFIRVLHNPVLLVLTFLGAVIAAPLIEEGAKALGLRWLRPWIKHPSSGWLLGLAAGLGFGMLEGAFNLDSTDNWLMGGWVRLAALLLHGLATSLTGLGYARYLQSNRRSDLWRGYRRAVVMHGAWNASAIGLGAIAATAALSGSPLLGCGGALAVVGLIVFMVLLIRRVSTAGVQTSVQEDFQQANVPLPVDWKPMKFNFGWRLVGRRPIFVAAMATAQPEVPSPQPSDDPYTRRVEDDLKAE